MRATAVKTMEPVRSSDDSIQIVIRLRPSPHDLLHQSCLSIAPSKKTLEVRTRPTAKSFNFDFVADEKTSQVEYSLDQILTYDFSYLKYKFCGSPTEWHDQGNHISLMKARSHTRNDHSFWDIL